MDNGSNIVKVFRDWVLVTQEKERESEEEEEEMEVCFSLGTLG